MPIAIQQPEHAAVDSLLAAARVLPVSELPGFIGKLAEANAIATARLLVPEQHEELLDVEEAARRLNVSTKYLYANHSRFSFTRREGRKLLFSARGIDEHIRKESK